MTEQKWLTYKFLAPCCTLQEYSTLLVRYVNLSQFILLKKNKKSDQQLLAWNSLKQRIWTNTKPRFINV